MCILCFCYQAEQQKYEIFNGPRGFAPLSAYIKSAQNARHLLCQRATAGVGISLAGPKFVWTGPAFSEPAVHVGFYVFAGPDWSNIECRFCKACVRGPTGGASKVSWGLASGLSPRLADANTQPPCTFFRWPAASRSVGSRLRHRCSKCGFSRGLGCISCSFGTPTKRTGPRRPP